MYYPTLGDMLVDRTPATRASVQDRSARTQAAKYIRTQSAQQSPAQTVMHETHRAMHTNHAQTVRCEQSCCRSRTIMPCPPLTLAASPQLSRRE